MHTLGIDLGTSGVRAVVLAADGGQRSHAVSIPHASRRDPASLWAAVATVLDGMALGNVGAIAVAGTSGTLLATDQHGAPRGELSMYNDKADPAAVAAIDKAAPADSPARGHTSPLGRAIGRSHGEYIDRIMHEADWIAGMLCGRFGVTDENNALKTGYDPILCAWPDWITHSLLPPRLLPRVLPPGQPIAAITGAIASRFALPPSALVATGTTDGCASFLSTGASKPGDAVTVLGSTLTLKLLSAVPVSAPQFGIYSHRLWNNWLTGGASNTGGAVLAQFFPPGRIAALSTLIDPDQDSGFRYYPLPGAGERFPVNNPAQLPVLTPRPADDALFLHGMLEGIARIEALGYRHLQTCGAPALRSVATVGGGAANPAWSAMRQRILGVPISHAQNASAAHGAALVARHALEIPPQCTAAANDPLA